MKQFSRLTRRLYSLAAVCASGLLACSPCFSQDAVCDAGAGSFAAKFRTGVVLNVGATKVGAMATRSCEASLSWSRGTRLIATTASQVDVDSFGVDIGVGLPVTTLQIRKSSSDCCREYQIYSLDSPPLLIRTVTGGDYYGVADVDMDGQLEVWTHDAVGVEGFERLHLSEFDFLPTVVFRVTKEQLVDESADFQSEFDRQIALIRESLTPDALRDFRSSDGKLTQSSITAVEHQHQLRTVKIRVLELVWAYLYSGRESQAWNTLGYLWPAGDVGRIRSLILERRGSGIRKQLVDDSKSRYRPRKRKIQVFDAIGRSETEKPQIGPPIPIMLHRPPVVDGRDQPSTQPDVLLELIIDSAGKVRSATAVGKADFDPDILKAAREWKFIPASRNGQAVACRSRLEVSTRQ